MANFFIATVVALPFGFILGFFNVRNSANGKVVS
jgi:hypothetical protein